MFALLHGYLLEGSGSNLWTRSVARALCKLGISFHLFCQEPHPEHYDFIAEGYLYPPQGSPRLLFRRNTPYPGQCIFHKPLLGPVLPVYVWDHYEEFDRVVPMTELPDEAIEDYLDRNLRALRQLMARHPVRALHANHAVLMSVVALRAHRETGVPFAVMPHGSAIEYAVKKDPRFWKMAAEAFAAARKIFVIGPEMRTRVCTLFPDISGLEAKLVDLPLGVDTEAFHPVHRAERPRRIRQLIALVGPLERGKPPAPPLPATRTPGSLRQYFETLRTYDPKKPDVDLEEKLRRIDWERAQILLFVGRLIRAKGVQAVVAAFPTILQAHPQSRLVISGHGPLREVLEAWIAALGEGDLDLARWIVDHGGELEGAEGGWPEVQAYWTRLQAEGHLENYLKAAQRLPEAVLFTGYLSHRELRHLFPCGDAAVFPSIVREAGPLVFLEALSSGVFPIGTDFGGMAESIQTVARFLPEEAGEVMRLRPDLDHLVGDIADRVVRAFRADFGERFRETLHTITVRHFDWSAVARTLVREWEAMAQIP